MFWNHTRLPEWIVLDLDANDDPVRGHQEGRFFHGYCDCHSYQPLYVGWRMAGQTGGTYKMG